MNVMSSLINQECFEWIFKSCLKKMKAGGDRK